MSFPQAAEQGLEDLKQVVAGVCGERLKGIDLYGSCACGDFPACFALAHLDL